MISLFDTVSSPVSAKRIIIGVEILDIVTFFKVGSVYGVSR